jgi:hypothetical protein
MTKMAEAKPIKLKTLSGTVEVTGPGNETTTHTVKIEVNDLEIAVPPESWRAKAGRLFLQLLPLLPGLVAHWIAAIINPSLDLQRERRQQPILRARYCSSQTSQPTRVDLREGSVNFFEPAPEPRHNYREVVVTLPRINQRKHSVFIGVAYPADREAILREIGALTVLLEPERGGAPIEITDAIQSKTSCE